jgi:hypothetical protein
MMIFPQVETMVCVMNARTCFWFIHASFCFQFTLIVLILVYKLILIPSHNFFFVGNLGTHFKFSFCYKTKNQKVSLPLMPFNKHKGVLGIEFFSPSGLMHS